MSFSTLWTTGPYTAAPFPVLPLHGPVSRSRSSYPTACLSLGLSLDMYWRTHESGLLPPHAFYIWEDILSLWLSFRSVEILRVYMFGTRASILGFFNPYATKSPRPALWWPDFFSTATESPRPPVTVGLFWPTVFSCQNSYSCMKPSHRKRCVGG